MPLVAHIAQRVVIGGVCRKVRDELLVLKLVEREVDTSLAYAVEVLHVSNHARLHLKLHLVGIGWVLVTLFVSVLEGETLDTASRNDFCTKVEGHCSNNGRAHHIGNQQPTITDASTYHCDDFAAVGQLRGEEDDADEDEQGTEKVGIVGDEVQVILHHDGSPRGMRLREAVDILIEIEHYTNANNQHDGKEVSAEELTDDVAVNSFHCIFWVWWLEVREMFGQLIRNQWYSLTTNL